MATVGIVYSGLTHDAATRLVSASLGLIVFAGPHLPLKLRLMTTNGDDTTNGTEVSGGLYIAQTYTPAAADEREASNAADIVFSSLPDCEVVGVEIWDTKLVPYRTWLGSLDEPITVTDGEDFTFPANSCWVQIG